jgi:hypothetical protein
MLGTVKPLDCSGQRKPTAGKGRKEVTDRLEYQALKQADGVFRAICKVELLKRKEKC